MTKLAWLLLLVPTSAVADPEPIIDLKSIVPRMQTHGEDMAALEIPSTIIASPGRHGGEGKLRAARAFLDDGEARIGLVTARGFQSFRVDIATSNNFVTLEEMRWTNVVGDAEPELWATINTYRDPCGCDDGPTFSHTYVVVCRASGSGAQCSPAIEISMSENVAEERSFSGELKIQTEPDGRVFGRVGIREATKLSRRERASITHPVRLF